jgi:hypothetical protein
MNKRSLKYSLLAMLTLFFVLNIADIDSLTRIAALSLVIPMEAFAPGLIDYANNVTGDEISLLDFPFSVYMQLALIMVLVFIILKPLDEFVVSKFRNNKKSSE